jgi:uncharacterized protein YabE (DUF348 family)/3D (Asp-Asp-Asp) domain-containing protein
MHSRPRPHRKRIIAVASALAALIVFSASVTAYAMNSRTVLVSVDGEQVTVTTAKADVYEILRTKDITLGNDDYLDLSAFSEEGDCVVRIHRAKRVYLVDGEETRQLRCAGTVGRLLETNGVVLGERDKLSHAPGAFLDDGMEVVISRAFDVMVRDYGADYPLVFTEGTVALAMEAAGIRLETEDYIDAAMEDALFPGMTIHVSRVRYRERLFAAAVDFEVVENRSKDIDLGVVKVTQKGVKGRKETLYLDKFINGERVDSSVLEENILQAPVREIRLVGTRVARLTPGLSPISTLTPPSSLEIVDGRPTHYLSTVTGLAKAYSGGLGTASGLKPQPGYVAVDPRQFPYGTKLWIVSNDGNYIYGYAVAADTGGFVKTGGCMIDLYMPNEAMCNQWGARGVTVYVLDEPRMRTPYGG